ncbi:alpha/beta hydrolase [Microbacterium sp. BK668]|uniref:alpha/beta hydrolase n=1 Tax=Microbacterium sp. BK668 TaxID=2512118 RepID=UPI00105C3D03|nr:alpha/beta hydrolase [Microbacterium sp. BK668]TDN90547.1 acetyl esterase/lipase [Microbacterium sp. BK668]
MSSRTIFATVGAALIAVVLTSCTTPAVPTSTGSGTPTTAAADGRESVVYRTVDGDTLSADICLPDAEGQNRPAMILVHGGGFTEGSRSSMGALCDQFASRGIVGVAIDYRLLPDHPYPAPVEDANAAVAWLRQPDIAAQYGVDAERVGMLGSSAGAIITASVATEPDSGLAAAAALSPVGDMTVSGLELGTPTAAAAATILAYLGCPSIEDCPQSEAASPTKAVDANDVPLFLAVGSRELVPREQVEALHSELAAAGVPTEVMVVSGDRHGLALLNDDVRRSLFEFLSEHLES